LTPTPEVVDPAEVGMSGERLGHAADLMERQFTEGRSPMLAAVVARHGKVVFTKVLGDQRPGGPPLALDSVFPLASNGKPMTAATLLALVERGLVGLTEPVVVHLPELEVNDNGGVLVHHLLTHTSGWADEDLMEAVGAGVAAGISEPPPGRDWLEHLFLETAWAVPRTRGVGQVMLYATHNYTFISEIIRRVTGDTVDAAMRRYVLDPVGMADTAVIVPDELLPRVVERPHGIPYAPGYPESAIAHYDPLWLACDDGGFGVHGTVLDYLAFQEMIRNGGVVGDTRVLCGDSIRVMTTDQIPGTSAEIGAVKLRDACWGYGFSVGGPSPVMHWRGGTPSRGTLRHAGAGGIGSWIDPTLGISAVYHELITEETDGAPESWAIDRFEDIVTAAVLD
jgi:CubicO group peptidase (beta-lactamase class C family)